MTEAAGPTARRNSLDTATVVGEAVHIADEHGVEELTMRQLAARLGVKAMTLYRYVDSREALLDAMVAALLDQLAVTMTSRTRDQSTDSRYLTETAHDVRDLALSHPWLIRLMVLRPAPAVWLSRPLSSLACTDTFLDALHRRGFSPDSSVGTYRRFNAFLLAHLLLESSAGTQDAAVAGHRRRRPPTPLNGYPVLASYLELLATTDPSAEFGRALHLFVRSATQAGIPTAAATPATSTSTTSTPPTRPLPYEEPDHDRRAPSRPHL